MIYLKGYKEKKNEFTLTSGVVTSGKVSFFYMEK